MGVQLSEKGSWRVIPEEYKALEHLLTQNTHKELSIPLPQPIADTSIKFELELDVNNKPVAVGPDVVKRLYDELNNTFDQLVPGGPPKLYESEVYEHHRLKIWLTQDGRLARFLHDWTFGEWGPDSRPERKVSDTFYLSKGLLALSLKSISYRAAQAGQSFINANMGNKLW